MIWRTGGAKTIVNAMTRRTRGATTIVNAKIWCTGGRPGQPHESSPRSFSVTRVLAELKNDRFTYSKRRFSVCGNSTRKRKLFPSTESGGTLAELKNDRLTFSKTAFFCLRKFGLQKPAFSVTRKRGDHCGAAFGHL